MAESNEIVKSSHSDESSSSSSESIVFTEDDTSISIQNNAPLKELDRYYTDFEDSRILGVGGFGSVYKCKHKLDGREYAVKKIVLSFNSTSEKDVLLREVKILTSLNHPCVVRYSNAWIQPLYDDGRAVDGTGLSLSDDPSFSYTDDSSNGLEDTNCDSKYENLSYLHSNSELRMSPYVGTGVVESIPRCTHGLYIQMQLGGENLRNWLDLRNEQHSKVPEYWSKERTLLHIDIFRDITSGLEYLHSKKVMHRDIKPANIIFYRDSNRVFITDFGLARKTDHSENISTRSSSMANTQSIGTPIYCAPEIATNVYTNKVDIYSLGIILMELIYLFQTTSERAHVLHSLRNNIIDKTFAKKWDLAVKLIQWMTNSDPEKRPDANTLHSLILNSMQNSNAHMRNSGSSRFLLRSISLNSAETRRVKKTVKSNAPKLKKSRSLSFSRRSRNSSSSVKPNLKEHETNFLKDISLAKIEFTKLKAKTVKLETNQIKMKAEIRELRRIIANLVDHHE